MSTIKNNLEHASTEISSTIHLLLFQTDITSRKKVRYLKPLLNKHSDILGWSIDLEDSDKVLRIEAKTNLTEADIMGIVKDRGFHIEVLED
ncbi:hypothetical protein L0P88_19940 [Muricauda sp. SCSIO 64092]|uniref:hypothetical protein n=1 Tax=Allomuricauda sp. SCSIO 64092 TaxID=2908842 RepID=UPI001FF4770F|nr:hypothetical protein [Muricauda sp. SCSIO 64092]UOY06183.1 hypothetical protein L0P88_19940 [Muricauda sp. SCSIO 64092]